MVEFYSPFPAKFNESVAEKVVALDDIPLIQLNPGKFNKYAIRRIATGADDKWIRSYTQAVKAFKYCVVISFGHEMNGWWYRWGKPWNTPATFIKAWRHIHDTFARVGADNVIWSWDPSHQHALVTDGKVAYPAALWYPGSKYVDWVGLDGYLGKDHNGTPQNFNEIFAAQVASIRKVAPGKLLYLAETGVAPGPAQVNQIAGLFAGIRRDCMAGLIWFEQDRKQRWKLAGRPPAIAAYGRAVNGFPAPRAVDVPGR